MSMSVDTYENLMRLELEQWKLKMIKEPSFFGTVSKKLQTKINSYIPEKIHNAITTAIKQMTRGILFGAGLTYPDPPKGLNLQTREIIVQEKIKSFRNAAAAEGVITGAGGILLGLADFPIWLTLKMKMLFEIAATYGVDVKDLKERIYILHIFQLTFSSEKRRREIFQIMEKWQEHAATLPQNINELDWRTFQQEYRDYIDLAKLLQLVPGIGAAVGGYVNHRLTEKLGRTAMNAYRLRWPLGEDMDGKRIPLMNS
jgi:hypothetical protein